MNRRIFVVHIVNRIDTLTFSIFTENKQQQQTKKNIFQIIQQCELISNLRLLLK